MAKTNNPETKSKQGCLGCLVSVVIVVGIIGAVASGGHHTTPAAQAKAYIKEHGLGAKRVAASVEDTEIQLGLAIKAGASANVDELAQAAQSAHDAIDEVRNEFATTETSGELGAAALDIFTAANGLKNAMGALVAYTGNPNPATLAHFTTQFSSAREEWDHGVSTIWSTAHEGNAPTLGHQ
jgi:hypothetical protein